MADQTDLQGLCRRTSERPHVHAAGAVRHAEKRRAGTCAFANRVARASLEAYAAAVPPSYREGHKHTCVAAIVAHVRPPPGDGDAADDCLQVMGLGAGTKFLPEAVLRAEEREDDDAHGDGYGKRLRDCHAEVLARRAFRRQVAREILLLGTAAGDDAAVDAGGGEAEYFPILEETTGDCDGNGRDNGTHVRYRLKPGVTLHFYASSAPCKWYYFILEDKMNSGQWYTCVTF